MGASKFADLTSWNTNLRATAPIAYVAKALPPPRTARTPSTATDSATTNLVGIFGNSVDVSAKELGGYEHSKTIDQHQGVAAGRLQRTNTFKPG